MPPLEALKSGQTAWSPKDALLGGAVRRAELFLDILEAALDLCPAALPVSAGLGLLLAEAFQGLLVSVREAHNRCRISSFSQG